MAFKDNREFVEALVKTGDAVRIKKEVDWDMEAGGITRRVCEMQGPAPFFEKIKDYPDFRMFGAVLSTYRRLAIAMGLKPETPVREIQAEYARRVEKPIKPVLVKKGPCQENVLKGEDVDLYRLPAPMVHEGDAGRYLATWHAIVSKDPDSDWTNWGTYRVMIHNKKNVGCVLRATSHLGRMFYGKYMPKKKPMPAAIAIGMDPLCTLMSVATLPQGLSEVDYAGGVRQEPVELVKCLTSDIMVPAHAEIVVEGEIMPDMHLYEGPFGEWTGYRTSGEDRPVWRINAITYRNNAILTCSNMGVPVDDSDICWGITTAVECKKHILAHGIPVVDVFIPPQCANQLIVVSIKAITSNLPTMVKNVIHSTFDVTQAHIVLVTDDDVDAFNMAEVFHAFSTKCHPDHGVRPSDYDIGIPLWPFLSPYERRWFKGARLLLDCTWPRDWSRRTDVPPRSSFNDMYPKALKDKVVKEWQSYGFK